MSLAIHTDCPLIPLTQMVASDGTIEVGKAAAGGADCFYGWAEAQHTEGSGCRPHHIVIGTDDEATIWIAKLLDLLGHQVVVTAPVDPDDQTGDHVVVDEDVPNRYDWAHAH